MFPRLFSPGGRHRLPLILQSEAAECGLACLAMVAGYHGHAVGLRTLRQRHATSLMGVDLRRLMDVASALALSPRPLRVELDNLRQLRLPAVLHFDFCHFVVLKKSGTRHVMIHDPANGERRLSWAEVSRRFTGVALELTPTPDFVRRTDTSRLRIRDVWGRVDGLAPAFVQVIALSVLLELFVLVSPLYMQRTVDDVISRGDLAFMGVLAVGFGLLTFINLVASAIRTMVLNAINGLLGLQMETRLFRHLVRLPLPFFAQRHVGDVLSRFNSLAPIRTLITQSLITTALDGVLAVATGVMLFVYSLPLALIAVGALALYAATRLAFYRPLRRRGEELIRADAEADSFVIETLRAIQSLKLFNAEAAREADFANKTAAVIQAAARKNRIELGFKIVNDAIFGLETVVIVYVAACLAVTDALTVGMIYAFMAYRGQFVSKAVSLIEKAIEFRLLDLHLERLADIALTPLEPSASGSTGKSEPIRGALELRQVEFRFAEGDRPILRGIDLVIEPGQSVAITGPSGCGKSTLLKIILGLYAPTTGEVRVDGWPLGGIDKQRYRENVAAVMQDDHLLAGSIADNIAFGQPQIDFDWLETCVAAAALSDDIRAMPMGYDTLVGDMGSSLSGGQKQRVLLARALYRRPRILVLDEGTSHLDLETEARIVAALKSLKITRIQVAHRPQSIEGADLVLHLAASGVLVATAQEQDRLAA